jgi:5-(carboxyamino)imidazole ribonucleotide mutase
MSNTKPQVGVIMGSDNDWKVVKKAVDTLKNLGIGTEVHVMSAHRTPAVVVEFVSNLQKRGFKTIIAAAGMSAHLAGVTAAHTALPVIGLPISASNLDGLDALLSIVNMPPGIPVATVAIDGAVNAGLLAAQIIGASDPDMYAKMLKYKEDMAAAVIAKDKALQDELNG